MRNLGVPISFTSSLLWLALPLFQHSLVNAADTTHPPAPSWTGCPVGGPLLPRPTNLGESKHIRDATAQLAKNLDAAISGELKAGWDVENSSFSIAFVSPNAGGGNLNGNGEGVLWDYHHRGERNVNGTKQVDGDSQYLVGSVSKVFSALLLLQSGLNMEDPITKFLPELKGDGSAPTPIQWENVTLDMIPAHLAGIPPNSPSAFEFYFMKEIYEKLGFPHLEDSDYPECGVAGLNEACNKDQLLKDMLSLNPVDHPYSRPVYSQLSFMLSTLALEAVSGKNYSQQLDEGIVGPLGLSNTGPSPGNDERAVIPPIEQNGWGSDYGLSAPGGGLYSSTNDLSSLLNSILDRTILPTPDDVRKFLRPRSMTASPSTLVGEPWEIQRTTALDPKHPHHTIDILAKSGGAQGYIAQISVIDEYGVGVVVLTAGPQDTPTAAVINEAVLSSLIPAVEQEAREQAAIYLGEFNSAPPEKEAKKMQDKTAAPITMKTSMDDGPGVKLDVLTRDGADILGALRKVWGLSLPMMNKLSSQFRIYPDGIERPVPRDSNSKSTTDKRGNKSQNLVQQDWRINFDPLPMGAGSESELPGQGSLADLCTSWQTIDWIYYGGESVDKIVFTVDKDAGQVVGVEIPFLRSGMLVKRE